jgi:hypothetical protein
MKTNKKDNLFIISITNHQLNTGKRLVVFNVISVIKITEKEADTVY